MVKNKLVPVLLAVGFLVLYAVSSLRSNEIHHRAGQRNLLQATTDANEPECTAEPNAVGLHYNYFIYCMVGNEAGGMVILVIWWLLLFVGLATCADDFFCPALVVCSENLGLSPNVAGVTLLAIGNGAPDFFAAFSALSGTETNSQMGIGAIFGAAIFVTTILIGVIGAIKPFKASERPFLRDIIFYLGAVYWGFYMLWRKKVYFWECIGYIILYVVYVVVVIISSSVYKRQQASKKTKNTAKLTSMKKLDGDAFENKGFQGDALSRVMSISLDASTGAVSLPPKIEIIPEGGEPQYDYDYPKPKEYDYEYPKNVSEDENHIKTTLSETGENKDDLSDLKTDNLVEPSLDLDNVSAHLEGDLETKDASSDSGSESKGDPEPSTLTLLLYGLVPVDIQQWSEISIPGKCYQIFRSPVMFVMNLACPVVNYNDTDHHNWNRPLQTLQLFLSPSLLLFLIAQSSTFVGVFPVVGITFIIGAVLAALCFFLTSNFPRPKYHGIFAIYGFIAALLLIYVLANEIVGFLQTFGAVTNINDTILGLTFLAWGNSMGDLMANVVMARQGFPKMSFAACFGASLFNLTLGFGLSMLINMVSSGDSEAELEFGPVELILSAFLMFSLVVNLAGIALFQRFRITRPYGGILLGLYLVFLVVVVLTGTDVILADLEL